MNTSFTKLALLTASRRTGHSAQPTGPANFHIAGSLRLRPGSLSFDHSTTSFNHADPKMKIKIKMERPIGHTGDRRRIFSSNDFELFYELLHCGPASHLHGPRLKFSTIVNCIGDVRSHQAIFLFHSTVSPEKNINTAMV